MIKFKICNTRVDKLKYGGWWSEFRILKFTFRHDAVFDNEKVKYVTGRLVRMDGCEKQLEMR